MAKHPKPWYRKSRGVWYVQIDGRQYNLGPDREKAFISCYQMMAGSHRSAPSARIAEPESLAVIFDKFLDWTQRNRAPRTYDWYSERLQAFIQFKTRLRHSICPVVLPTASPGSMIRLFRP